MATEISRLKKTALDALKKVKNLDELETLRLSYLGRKQGAVTQLLRSLNRLPLDARKVKGKEANELARRLEHEFTKKQNSLENQELEQALKKERIDITRPGFRTPRGHLHPITNVRREVEAIFRGMGFRVATGPKVETEWYNFDALNIPKEHPARDLWDTIWLRNNQKLKVKSKKLKVGEKLLLRTHTSPVQVRYLEKNQPPFKIIAPGEVYRYEATDASHDFQFWQVEGLMVDRNVSVANFRAIVRNFYKHFFKKDVKIRLRPSFFPFVEPGFEVDLSCINCGGKGCKVCSQTGWLEMMGAGMVHPKVFENTGYSPREWQGIAFGMGMDRLVMMRYRIPDIRLLRSGDLRFLNQF